MAGRVALCADEMTCLNPDTVGLDGESLLSQPWLSVYHSGQEARRGIAEDESIEEAWVISTDDVEPINLAATLKSDRPDLRVCLVSFEGCGSLFSRAHTAHIDEIADRAAFVRRYSQAKTHLAGISAGSPVQGFAPDAVAVLTEADSLPAFAPLAVNEPAPAQSPQVLPVAELLPVATPGHAFIMPVVSGSGGAGKSVVSVMSAFLAREMGYRTLLLDYDLQFGDAAVLAGVENPLAIDAAIAHPDWLEKELRRDNGLVVLAAPERLEAAESVVKSIPQLLESLSSSFDVIVANTGAAWAEQHAALLERCSAALFLVDQRASSVRACRHALELCARCGIASGPFQFAVNRCSKNAPLTSVDVSCALQGAPVFELRDGGRDVEDFLGGGAASELLESRNEFCTSLSHVLETLLPGNMRNVIELGPSPDERRLAKKHGRHVGRKRGRGAS